MGRTEGEQALQHHTAGHSFASAGKTVEEIQISFVRNRICNHVANAEGTVPLDDSLPFLPVLIRDGLEHLTNARKQRASLNLQKCHSFAMDKHAGFLGGVGGVKRGEGRGER